MLSCKETTQRLSESHDRPLGWRERLAVRVHTLMCRGCRNYDRQLDILDHACHQLRGDALPDEDDDPTDTSGER